MSITYKTNTKTKTKPTMPKLMMSSVQEAISEVSSYGFSRRASAPKIHFKSKSDSYESGKLKTRDIEQSVYLAESGDMAGFREQRDYNNNEKPMWNPKEDFIAATSGDTLDSGAFQGGDEEVGKQAVKAPKKKEYAQTLGKATSKNPNPFPIRVKKNVRFK